MKRTFFLLVACVFSSVFYAQDFNLNKYKFVIVKSKFDFVKSTDGYQTSSLTKFLFDKMGFEVYLDNEEYPEELAMNPCSALYSDVKDDSGFLKTKSFIELKDCKGKILYITSEGTSRSKQYVKAYRESIKEAFKFVEALGYQYNPSLDKETSEMVVHQEHPVEEKPKETIKKPVMVTKEVVTKVEVAETEKKPTPKEVEKKKSMLETLYAQPNENGFQLVNTKPEVVFVLLKTSDPNQFFIKDKNGTFTKTGDTWLAEYYDQGTLVTQKFVVKF